MQVDVRLGVQYPQESIEWLPCSIPDQSLIPDQKKPALLIIFKVMPRLTYIGIHGHYVQSSLLDNCLFLKIWPDLFAGSLTEVLFIRDDHT